MSDIFNFEYYEKNLPEKQRKLGIFYGALGAIVLRVIMVFFDSALLLFS